MQRDLSHVEHDYRFGRPTVYLTTIELARLAVLRSRLGDTHAERVAHAAGRAADAENTGRGA